jgi:predicted AAA+ superfamily ATPase
MKWRNELPKAFVLTGSNSGLLGSEIATSLRGRTLSMEVFPLSFSEYLRFQGLEADVHSSGPSGPAQERPGRIPEPWRFS